MHRIRSHVEFFLNYTIWYNLLIDYTYFVITITTKILIDSSLYTSDIILNNLGWIVFGTSTTIFYFLMMKIAMKFLGPKSYLVENKIRFYRFSLVFIIIFSIIWGSIGIYILKDRINDFQEITSIPRNLVITYFVFILVRSLLLFFWWLWNRKFINSYQTLNVPGPKEDEEVEQFVIGEE